MTNIEGNDTSGRVLIVDDDQSLCELVVSELSARHLQVDATTDAEAALGIVTEGEYDAVVLDMNLGASNGLELCRRILERRPELPVVMITAFGSMDAAIGAIRVGAYDFVNKPLAFDSLALTVERAVQHHRLKQEVRRLQQEQAAPRSFDDMIGESRAMSEVFEMLTRLEDSAAAVLIVGESGTGKELVARALHTRSRFREGSFVAVNCAAVPATLLESTLFGHVRGAFTDAKSSREGLFVLADKGTLFLDEIGEMALEMQSKLLRVLQERRVRPVGGSSEIPFDARIVTATNRDLEDAVERGVFREDLYYRINVVGIEVPPLRRRANDVLLLAQHFVTQVAGRCGKNVTGLATEAARKMIDYDWPGNVRQLQNVIERAVALTRFDKITLDDLPARITQHQSSQLVLADDDAEHMLSLDQLERRYIERVLKVTSGNKTQAARVLGLDRRTLYRKLDRYHTEDVHSRASAAPLSC